MHPEAGAPGGAAHRVPALRLLRHVSHLQPRVAYGYRGLCKVHGGNGERGRNHTSACWHSRHASVRGDRDNKKDGTVDAASFVSFSVGETWRRTVFHGSLLGCFFLLVRKFTDIKSHTQMFNTESCSDRLVTGRIFLHSYCSRVFQGKRYVSKAI